jgi:formate--tetrahydrofolate ligase
MSDIEIARAAHALPICDIAEKIGIPGDAVMPFGNTKAKIDPGYIETLQDRPDGKLILVTAISPTPAGEGKTTTSVGLHDGLSRIGKKSIVCLREPSLGPCFGMKGGAAGGGHAQVIPMEDINLHFTSTPSVRRITCCQHSSITTFTGATKRSSTPAVSPGKE